jgi:LacI family transcriptional regulator
MLTMTEPPTAIFAANDLSAIETMAVASDLGIGVPDDLSIVGFDNIPESALAEPALTTIDHAIQDQGFEAARMLMRLIDEPETSRIDVRLPTKLIVRQSCRDLRGGGG